MQTVTQADIEASIASEHYFTAEQGVIGYEREVILGGQEPDPANPDHWSGKLLPSALKLLTFCVLVTRNGHTVTGESYCQDPAKFDAETGRQWARKAAVDKLWPMVVYARRGEAAAAAVDPEAAADVGRVPRCA